MSTKPGDARKDVSRLQGLLPSKTGRCRGVTWVMGKEGTLERARYSSDRFWCPPCGDYVDGNPDIREDKTKTVLVCTKCKSVIDTIGG